MSDRRAELAAWRCRRHGLDRDLYRDVDSVVSGLLAVQAQEHGFSRWALAQRVAQAGDDDVRGALASAAIVRTHVLRPTWHYVAGRDLAWLQALTADKVRHGSASWYRNHSVTPELLDRSKELLVEALAGGGALTREELRSYLSLAGLDVSGQRLTVVLFDAELEALVCSGPVAGTHHTYSLVSERLPATRPLSREAAIVELLRRYLAGHGPASLKDVRWWCGLTLKELRAAEDALSGELVREVLGGAEYLRLAGDEAVGPGAALDDEPRFQLLHVFDELFTGYSDTRALVDADGEYGAVLPLGYGPLPCLVLEGDRLVGQWRADRKGTQVKISVRLDRPFSEDDRAAFRAEAERYGACFGHQVEVVA